MEKTPSAQRGGEGTPPGVAEGEGTTTPRVDDPWFHPPEALTTIDGTGQRKWVYPAAIRGRFMRWRKALGYFVIAVFFVTPWVKVGGVQAILLDIPHRRFVLFGQVFWPQDMFYLVFLLLALTLALFLFTALLGRVWCGWLCPQTVFMEEVFRKIEEWSEGDHHARRRLDQAPWSVAKVARKAAKHALFLIFSALVSNTFIAYFVGTERLLVWMTGSPLHHWTAFLFMASTLGLFYFDFAWFREQFCVVLCPYARFQSVLTDQDTLQVGYDVSRGEPRGHAGKAEGDCVDCHLCVAVCPTGIDIRDGYQLECIGCTRCIDACDGIMARLNRPLGLIRYDSLARLSGAAAQVFRPRLVVYSVLLVAVVVAAGVGLGARPGLELTVVRPPGSPFSVLPGKIVSNHFSLRLHNREKTDKANAILVKGPPNVQVVTAQNPLPVAGGEQRRTEVFVNLPLSEVTGGKVPVLIQVFGEARLLAEQRITFLGPQRR